MPNLQHESPGLCSAVGSVPGEHTPLPPSQVMSPAAASPGCHVNVTATLAGPPQIAHRKLGCGRPGLSGAALWPPSPLPAW